MLEKGLGGDIYVCEQAAVSCAVVVAVRKTRAAAVRRVFAGR